MPTPTIPTGEFNGFAEAEKIRDANMDLWMELCGHAHENILPTDRGIDFDLETECPDMLDDAIDHVLDGFEEKFGDQYTTEQWDKIREGLYEHAHASFT